MLTAELLFTAMTGKLAGEAEDGISSLLAVFRKNGQILGKRYPLALQDNCLSAFVSLPQQDSFSKKYDNKYVHECKKHLQEIHVNPPQIRITGEDPGSAPSCEYHAHTSFILFTNYLSLESPLRCGMCFGPLSLYTVPKTYDEVRKNLPDFKSSGERDARKAACPVRRGDVAKVLLDGSSVASYPTSTRWRQFKR